MIERRRRSSGGSAAIVSVLVLAVVAAAAPASAAAPQFTPLTATVLAPPEPVEATDVRVHLVYEIQLLNKSPAAVDVQSLTARTDRNGTLLSLAGDQVPTLMTDVLGQPTRSLAAGQGGTLWLDVTLDRAQRVPRSIAHRLSVRATLPSGEGRTFTFDGARTRVSRRPAPVLAHRCVAARS